MPHPPASAPSHRKLKAYRQARTLASDVFWLTRRSALDAYPRHGARLRAVSSAMMVHVRDAWIERQDALRFVEHLMAAEADCTRLALGLNTALEAKALAPAQHEALLRQTGALRRTLDRLWRQCQPSIPAG